MEPQTLIATIEAAITEWTGCSWAHDRLVVLADGTKQTIVCDGGSNECPYCYRAENHAKVAAAYGREAIREVRAGRLDLALRLVEQAKYLERQYGDSPTWDPVYRMIRDQVSE